MTTLKKYLNEIKNKNIHVIGVSGTEGAEIALFLKQHQLKNVTLHDFAKTQAEFEQSFTSSHKQQKPATTEDKLLKLNQLEYPLHLQSSYLENIETADLIFVPQSWYLYPQNSILNQLKNKIQFSSITNLYLELAPCKIIGITGSNGKSTTTFLTHHLLSQNPNQTVHLTGNDRQANQILSIIDTISPDSIIVAEISNRQLLNTPPLAPDIAILTNITENHLSEHKDFQEYIDLKANITKFQKPNNTFIYNTDNEICAQISKSSQAETFGFGQSQTNNCYFDAGSIYINQKPIIKLSELKIRGTHNYYNACAAILAALKVGINEKQIIQGLKTFTGLPQRIEFVRTYNNLNFYDDRQGTAIDATVQAINTLRDLPITLIIGGTNKAKDLTPLLEAIIGNISVIGIESPFVNELKPEIKTMTIVKNLPEAIKKALAISASKTNILFSPACEYGPYFNPLKEHPDAEKYQEIINKL
jgi:UDP-N-acetylmuramoylalanine--D-glutamate ligase